MVLATPGEGEPPIKDWSDASADTRPRNAWADRNPCPRVPNNSQAPSFSPPSRRSLSTPRFDTVDPVTSTDAPTRTTPPPSTGIAAPSGAHVRLWVCPTCQYDLSGLPDNGLCPECGGERTPGILHIGGWADAARVPFGPRARLRAVIFSLVLSVPFGALLGRWIMSFGVLLPAYIPYLAVAATLLGITWWYGGRSVNVGQRPLELELRPDGIHFSGRVWSKRLIPWSRYRVVRLRRRTRRMWELRILAPFWQRHLMETMPWHTGFWYVRLVFQGSKRDAALVRRVARRRVHARS